MFLHKCSHDSTNLYTLFDSHERVVVAPTRYLAYLRNKNRSVETQKHTASVIKLHCEWIEEKSFYKDLRIDESLKLIQSEDIHEWVNFQRNLSIGNNTINNREIIVREMYRWFTTEESIARKDIPWFNRVNTKLQRKKLPRFLTTEQVIGLLLGMHNESQRVTAHFIFDTGVRISELVRLKQKHLPIPTDAIYYPLRIPGSKSHDGSLHKERITMISRPMLVRIRRYHNTLQYKFARGWDTEDPEKPIFLNVKGDGISKSSVYKMIKSAWIRQGKKSEEVSPHKLRHGTAYSVMRSEFGNNLSDKLVFLKGIFGHNDIKTTEIYSSIPITVMNSLANNRKVVSRYEEADQIYQETYLPGYKNIEKRGRKIDDEKSTN